MGKPYSKDIRERVVEAVEEGLTQQEVAEMYKLGVRTVGRYMSLWRSRGSVVSGAKFGGHMKHKLAPHEDRVKELIAGQPDMTLEEVKEALGRDSIEVSKSAIDRYLTFLGMSRKKNASRRRAAAAGHSGSAGRMAGEARRV